MSTPSHEESVPPHARLIEMATAYWGTKVLYAAAKHRLADHLAEAPRSAAELAPITGTHAPTLHRLLRTLACMGVVTEKSEGRFSLTPLGESLRTGAPGSALPSVLTLASPWFVGAFENILHSLETGGTGFEKAMGMPVFHYLAQNPEDAANFNATMIGFHGAEPAAVAEAYDFSGFGTLVDVGGGTGNLLSTVLQRYAGPRGILFDMPHVIAQAAPLFEERGVAGRVSLEAGNFFEDVPAGGDAYLLSHIIHDWNDEQCLTILGHCRKRMTPEGRLLLVEMVLPEGDEPHPGKMLDMVMLLLPGGQERTRAQYADLLGRAGLRLDRVVPTASAVSVVEAVRA
jgi:hypothetical protein